MSIKGLELISATPRKNGKISVLMEIDRTKENIRALVELYGSELTLLTKDEMEAMPQDRNTALSEIWDLCYLVTKKLDNLCDCEYFGKCQGDPQKEDYCPIQKCPPADPPWTEKEKNAKIDTLLNRLTAPDEIPPTHAKGDMMAGGESDG